MPYPYPEVSYWEELEGSPVENWTYFAFQATVTFLCPWNERTTMAASIMADGGEFYYRIPQAGARARSVEITPFPAQVGYVPGQVATQYEKAQLVVQYDSNAPDGDLIQESLEPSAEMLQMGNLNFAWGGWVPVDDEANIDYGDPDAEGYWIGVDLLREDESPTKIVRTMDWKLTIHKVVSLPEAAMELGGCVNDRDVQSPTLGRIFKKGTLLFQPPSAQRTLTVDTNMTWQKTWELCYRFTYKPDGFNRFWRKKSQQYEIIVRKTSDGSWEPYNNYPEADFSPILPWLNPESAKGET